MLGGALGAWSAHRLNKAGLLRQNQLGEMEDTDVSGKVEVGRPF